LFHINVLAKGKSTLAFAGDESIGGSGISGVIVVK